MVKTMVCLRQEPLTEQRVLC